MKYVYLYIQTSLGNNDFTESSFVTRIATVLHFYLQQNSSCVMDRI
jgi:hypothetical protein